MSAAPKRQLQTAYEARRYDPSQSLEERIRTAIFRYLAVDLGLGRDLAEARANREISGVIGREACNELAQLGIVLTASRVVDLGTGLGGFAAELASRGARVIALEPGEGWYKVAAARLYGYATSSVVAAVGELIPLASESVDLIVSLQVLEHVSSPKAVIQEAFRILKPGGYFYFSYENYFSFWEPHYRLPWLPLLPKLLGSIYLRILHRDPRFLNESITYTTYHTVRKFARQTGFACMRRESAIASLTSPLKTSLKWRTLKSLGKLSKSAPLGLLAAVDYSRHVMRTGIYECFRKPVG